MYTAGPHDQRVDDAVVRAKGVDASVGEDHRRWAYAAPASEAVGRRPHLRTGQTASHT